MPDTIPDLELRSAHLSVTCSPARGLVLRSLRDGPSGAEALWSWSRTAPSPPSRVLGPSGGGSVETFIDGFVGGWFAMFPTVGYPLDGDPSSLLHGELVRLPWTVTRRSDSVVEATVETVRSPFRVVRRLELVGSSLEIRERWKNVGREPARWAWGQHPCLSRATFAGGRFELDVERAWVPSPHHDHGAAVLRAGRDVAWPEAETRGGGTLDVSSIPTTPDGRVDHVCTRLRTGRARVTAPLHGCALVLEWDGARFPHALLWQNYAGRGGWPFWGACDTFAIEFGSTPGRSALDTTEAGAWRTTAPGAAEETTVTVAFERLAGRRPEAGSSPT